MLTFLSGLAAGAAHVVSGPDHLAALAPIAVDHPGRAASIGARWGLGHGAGVVLIGGLGVVARGFIDIEAASAWAEFSVGFMLIALGGWALVRARRVVIHDHGHEHEHRHEPAEAHAHNHCDPHQPHEDGAASAHTHTHAHAHVHMHASARGHDAPEAHAVHGRAAFLVGLLHGAAGAGHLFGVLPSLALPRDQAIIYLGAYVLAAVAAMAGFGAALGLLARRGGPRVVRRMMTGSAALAVVVGCVWLATAWPGA